VVPASARDLIVSSILRSSSRFSSTTSAARVLLDGTG
jgi:hypothetical protein